MPQPPADPALQAFARAVGLFSDGRAEEAAAACSRVLGIDPDHVGAHHLSGLIHHQAGRPDRALSHLERAAALAPGMAALHNDLGVAARAAGDIDRAEQAFARAAALAPGLAEAHNNLGTVCHARGRPDEAVRAFEAAIRHRPDYVNARYNLGAALQAAGRPEAALAAFDDLLALAPDHAAGQFDRGTVLAGLGRTAEAAAAFERALACDPADPFGARARLAALGRGPTPERTSLPLLLRTYRSKADDWDGQAGYRAAHLVAAAVAALPARTAAPDILDIGCGTGLVAEALAGTAGMGSAGMGSQWMRAAAMTGVDLSPEMLAHARAKGLYDVLHQADLVTFMTGRPAGFDLVTGAAVLIHFGDLGPVLAAIARCLRPGGHAVLTLLDHDAVDPSGHGVASHPLLLGGGCFAHGSGHLAGRATAAGLDVVDLQRAVHEGNALEEIPGLVATLARP